MRCMLVLLTIGLAVAGCSTLEKEKAPVCDGKHRRPANLYGSVLDPAGPPRAAATPEKLFALPTHGSCRG